MVIRAGAAIRSLCRRDDNEAPEGAVCGVRGGLGVGGGVCWRSPAMQDLTLDIQMRYGGPGAAGTLAGFQRMQRVVAEEAAHADKAIT